MFDYSIITVLYYSLIVCTVFSIFCCIGNYKKFSDMINECLDEVIEKLNKNNVSKLKKYKIHKNYKELGWFKKIDFKMLSFFKKIKVICGFYLIGFGIFIMYFLNSIIPSVALVILYLLYMGYK